jgi:hypothetical protein
MSRYRKVLSKIWTDDKFPRLSDAGKLLFLYHLTSERSTPFLLYVEGDGAIRDSLRWTYEQLTAAKQELEAAGLVRYSNDGHNIVFVPNGLKIKENAPTSTNAKKMWINHFKDLPQVDFVRQSLGVWLAIRYAIPNGLALAFVTACERQTNGQGNRCKQIESVGVPYGQGTASELSSSSSSSSSSSILSKNPENKKIENGFSGKAEYDRVSELTDRDEQVANIDLAKWQAKYPLLDAELVFEQWQGHRRSKGQLSIIDWEGDFQKWIAVAEDRRRKEQNSDVDADPLVKVEDRFSDEVFFRPMKAPY